MLYNKDKIWYDSYMELNDFGIFSIENKTDNYVYISTKLDDPIYLADKIFEVFFSEQILYEHFQHLSKSKFKPNQRTIALLYNNLQKFLSENTIGFIENITDVDLSKAFKEEVEYFKDNKIQRDKIGKIGEYLLNILIEKSFGYQLVLDKMKLISNRNMSVFGIDTIHYSKKENSLLFGESKLTSNLSNGIKFIEESLSKYEERLNEEIKLQFLSHDISELGLPKHIFNNAVSLSITAKEFLERANVEKIYIPIFIAHGKEINKDDIIQQLSAIPRKTFLSVNTSYIVISMPLLNSQTFVARILININKKCDELEKLWKLKK